MLLQNGTLIKIIDKSLYMNETNAIVLNQITEDNPWYINGCGYHQYQILSNNTIEFLGFFDKSKSWGIVHPNNIVQSNPGNPTIFVGKNLDTVYYSKVKVQFHDVMTNKWKRLSHLNKSVSLI